MRLINKLLIRTVTSINLNSHVLNLNIVKCKTIHKHIPINLLRKIYEKIILIC